MEHAALPEVISTDRFDLVWLDQRALERFGATDGDAVLRRRGWSNPHRHLLDEEAWIPAHFAARLDEDPRNATWTARVIVERASGEIVGHIGAHRAPDERRTVEMGYTVAPERRREHIASESLTAMIRSLEASRSVATVTLGILPTNVASIELARSAGFTFAGEELGDDGQRELRFERQLASVVS